MIERAWLFEVLATAAFGIGFMVICDIPALSFLVGCCCIISLVIHNWAAALTIMAHRA